MALRPLSLMMLLSITAATASAATDLDDVLVYARTSIEARGSDFEGPTVAGHDIQLSDFRIDGDLSAGASIAMQRGQIKGTANAPTVQLTQATSRGRGMPSPVGLKLAATQLDLLQLRLNDLAATTQPIAQATATIGGRSINGMKVTASRDLEVVDINADDLLRAGNLILSGSSKLVVRVHGTTVRLYNLGVFVESGLDPSRIVFFFPEARDLEITMTGGATAPNGVSWGIPGAVIAPCANLTFGSALITGQVFVDRIHSENGLPSGQINTSYSQIVRMILDDCGCGI